MADRPLSLRARPPNPAELAQKLLSENGGAKKPNLSELQRKLDAISIQDGALGSQIRAEVEKLLTPVQRGQLASATYMAGGVLIDPKSKGPAEQFRAPAGSADRANYNRLDMMYGDGNPKTNDSARIQQKINEQIASGLPLAKFLAQDRAVEKDWTAKAGDFLANFSPSGLLLEAAQPGIAALAKSAGLGNTEWGAHLQRVLDTSGTARAFNAGIQEGLVEGAKSFVVDIASIAGKAAQYVGDVSPGGFVGDAARWATPDAVKGWLKDIGVGGAINAAVPSAKRGYENTQALAKAGEAVGSYFANRTPGQVADDVKAKIGQMWDGIKADHAKAAAQGPEAEARWWGKIVGRATFEVASTFVPVAGQAGKVAKGAQAADKVADVVRATDKVADAVKAGDKVIDGTRLADAASNLTKLSSMVDEARKAGKIDDLLKVGKLNLDDLTVLAKAGKFNPAELVKITKNLGAEVGRDQLILWSGLGKDGAARATAYANEFGGKTLEMTKGGKWLDDLRLFDAGSPVSRDEAAKIWGEVSRNLAEKASGQVRVVRGPVSPSSVYKTIELPALLNNPKVLGIEEIFLKPKIGIK
jgi:hypothetical protein